MQNFKFLQNKLLNFLKDYLKQSNTNGFSLGLSGGLDSAIVCLLCKKVANTYALIMPTHLSSNIHSNDALDFCKKFNIDYDIIDIEPILNAYEDKLGELHKIRMANLSARIRMTILYDHSAKFNTLVVGTSNKSERMLGYGTIYGDMACALNPIGEIYKSDLFPFAKYLEINQNIIDKAPSADLWENQSDEEELGFSYQKIDLVLKQIDKGKNIDELKSIFESKLVECVFERIKKNKFKLSLPPIANIN